MKNCLEIAKENYPKLIVPKWQFEISQEEVEKWANDCGSKNTAWFVPNNILGLDIRIACKIHDLDYKKISDWYNSKTLSKMSKREKIKICEKQKQQADKRFKKNIEILADYKYISNKQGVFSLFFWRSEERQARIRKKEHYAFANIYYIAVKNLGWSSISEGFLD